MPEPTSSLQIPEYRRYLTARLLAVMATISMVVLIGYQVYDVARTDYGMDRSAAALQLGLLGLAQFVPLFVLTPVAGIAADRFDRRRVVLFANSIDALVALALALLTANDALNLPILFTLAGLHGAARVFNGPALSAIAPNIVPSRLLPQAIAQSSIAWQSGTVIGPALGGFLFAYDAPLPYFVSAATLLASGALISSVRPVRAVHEGPRLKPVRQMIDGFSFVKSNRFLLGCITLDLFAVLLGGATAMLPVFARDILQAGPEGLGLMRGATAAGAALVGVFLSFRPFSTEVGMKMLLGGAAFGAFTVGFALSRSLMLSLVMLAGLGAADMISVFIRNTLIQLNTPDNMRGRVSAISGLAISASNELGEMRAGAAAAVIGATGAVALGGAAAIVVTALWAWLYPELRQAKTFTSQFLDKERSP